MGTDIESLDLNSSNSKITLKFNELVDSTFNLVEF